MNDDANSLTFDPAAATQLAHLRKKELAAFKGALRNFSGQLGIGESSRLYSNAEDGKVRVAVDLHRDTMGGRLRISNIVVFSPLEAMARWTVSSRALRTKAARGSLELAARLAGARRSHLRGEWLAILAGSPEDGVNLSSRQQIALAVGFLFAALRLRLKDVARPAWRPVDWALRVPSRTNTAITVLVGCQAIYIVRGGGFEALIAEVWEPCGIAGAALFALAHWLRRVRGIELAASDRETADE